MPGVGAIFVELGINMGAFAEGLSKATYSAREAAREIGSSLREIGGVVGEIGEKFGEFGKIVGDSISDLGATVTKLVKEFGNLSGVAGTAKAGAIGIAGIAAAGVSAGAAMVGIAVHATEAAEKLSRLSQATGISVEELSGLSVVGRVAGISTEELAHGLERMSRSAVQAASNPRNLANGFNQMRISVTDASGQMKSASEIFENLVDKFSKMQDGAMKTAAAQRIFGLSGAQLIAMLNMGPEAFRWWIDYGTRVGAVLTKEAAEGAVNFRDKLTQLGLISEGVKNKLMTALLPSIDHIIQSITTFLETGDNIENFGKGVGTVLITLAKIVYEAGYAWSWWGDQIKITHSKMNEFLASHPKTGIAMEAAGVIPHGSTAVAGALGVDVFKKEIEDAKKDIQHEQDRLALMLADLNFKGTKVVGPKHPDQTDKEPPALTRPYKEMKPEEDYVADFIKKTELSLAEEKKLSLAINDSVAALVLMRGAAEGEKAVTEKRWDLYRRIKNLFEERQDAIKEGEIAKAADLSKHINELIRQVGTLNEESEHLVGIFASNALLKSLTAATAESQKQLSMVDAQLTAETELNDAKLKGPQALADAMINSQLKGKREQVSQSSDVLSESMKHPDIDPEAQLNAALGLMKMDENLKKTREDLVKLQQTDPGFWDKMRAETDKYAERFGTMREGFGGFIDSLIKSKSQLQSSFFDTLTRGFDQLNASLARFIVTGKGGFKQVLASMAESLIQLGLQLIESIVFKKIFDAAFATSSATQVAGTEAIRQSAIGAAAATAAMEAAVGGPEAAIIAAIVTEGALQGITALAGGGDTVPGRSYLVGEKGPEIFSPGSGHVFPNSTLSGGGGSAGHTVNVNTTVNAIDASGFEKILDRHASVVSRHVTRQLRLANARP